MSFLQSEPWEAFQRALGRTTTRVDGQLAIQHTTPLGPYWYVPRPSRFDPAAFIDHAKTTQAIFIRVDPSEESQIPDTRYQIPIRRTSPTQPQDSLVLTRLDTQSEDELLAGFHEKTRYNIHLAEKRGVSVEETQDVEPFLALARGTAERQAFRYHGPDYYRTLQATLGGSQLTTDNLQLTTRIFVAHYENRPLAAIIVLFDLDTQTAYYLHGASSYEHRQFMAPHLLQWEGIRRAKATGFKYYDFWGIAPARSTQRSVVSRPHSAADNRQLTTEYQFDPNHPWAGITRFKLGFGGEVVHYPNSFDVVFNPTLYTIYTLGRRVRRQLPI